ncbi:hypothetical protein BS78_06G012000 [Paspalum vaginatum]|nr:hypothetical protein BS78_06G012000 [Paspalum vaginatum]
MAPLHCQRHRVSHDLPFLHTLPPRQLRQVAIAQRSKHIQLHTSGGAQGGASMFRSSADDQDERRPTDHPRTHRISLCLHRTVAAVPAVVDPHRLAPTLKPLPLPGCHSALGEVVFVCLPGGGARMGGCFEGMRCWIQVAPDPLPP